VLNKIKLQKKLNNIYRTKDLQMLVVVLSKFSNVALFPGEVIVRQVYLYETVIWRWSNGVSITTRYRLGMIRRKCWREWWRNTFMTTFYILCS